MGELFLAAGLFAVVVMQAELMFRERRHHQEMVGLVESVKPEVRRDHVASLHNHIDQVTLRLEQAMPDPGTDIRVRRALHAFQSSHNTIQEQHVNGFPIVDTVLCKCDLCVAARVALG